MFYALLGAKVNKSFRKALPKVRGAKALFRFFASHKARQVINSGVGFLKKISHVCHINVTKMSQYCHKIY